MSIRIRVYPQYSSFGYGMSMGSPWGTDRMWRRRMRAQQRQIVRDQQLLSLHLLRQQMSFQRQVAQWNAGSAMSASYWGVPALTGVSSLPPSYGSYGSYGSTYGSPYGPPYGVAQVAAGSYGYW